MCDEAVVTIYVAEADTTEDNPLTACDSLFIPNGYSPNDDGINDYFEFEFLCLEGQDSIVVFEDKYPEARVEIYNRWGNLVYEKDNYGNVSRWGSEAWWDGRSSSGWTVGKDRLPSATYFYILYFNKGDEKPRAGTIFLNR